MKYKIIIFLLLFGLFQNGCTEDNNLNTQGLHFQGRNCIACHNNDLQEDRHLIIGGTLFKSPSNADGENLNTICNETLLINFLNENNRSIQYSSKLSTSKGNKGKGNFFILEDENNQNITGSYIMQIIKNDHNKTILADSLNQVHRFNDIITDSVDLNNRYSCNSCHTKGGLTKPLFPNKNPCN